MMNRVLGVTLALAASAVLAGSAARDAHADIALLSARPATASVGQVIEVRAGAYKRFAPMPLYLVRQRDAPKPHPCGPKTKQGKPGGLCEPIVQAPPHGSLFHFVGRLDFTRHPRDTRLDFRLPVLASGIYEFVIYCDACHHGMGGTLITNAAPTIRIRKPALLGRTAAGESEPARAGKHARRGPWLLTSLPGLGRIMWSCDPRWRGYRTYVLTFDPSASTATERLTMRAGGRSVYSRLINPPWKPIALPRMNSPLQTIRVNQATEPGTLRAVVTVSFKGTVNLPWHCAPYLPPAMTVQLFPR